ncbi:XRE family transcriptional regulator [Lactiplantibacillus mudanjiangensis]|uniref:HTH cro/C1-type domain-containing protein n=1 Tax=Lactiplantibacillus mudanjiangensis TaxID=1296538 RepID=A0A660E1X9_9LACO|nr:XRE family transcriptional regulator [Lactiplantibacillus mudanjiangensis]VDG19887.1 hypothetical protein [Lactobacillus sp. CBA3606] [Lactiplantibacillus mudanjiangensis]VDG23790.1 hypothetical protein [Lactobacillus sp. CBA3606] [Lactiplantibacillus mudanjiangensis]VDG29728.1 hypothetical protein [Lactobacillus sp. CBA3606] [Lactiplantibacillus mudanjiangensis]VDG31309.1 hypothetical protein [Lactobacillus sp. CBA3606] [Lactiplantibacillus mudanjiangensis]
MQEINIVREIQTLLDSDLTAYRIGKDTGVDNTLIRRLKSGERPVENISVKVAQKLLDYRYKVIKDDRVCDE